MTVALLTRGMIAGASPGGSDLEPTISNQTPAEGVTPGASGGFSAVFRVARLTPIEFDLDGIPDGTSVIVIVSYADRNETLTAFDLTGARRWPFDVQTDNEVEVTGAETRHVRLLPRGGWPPVVVSIDAGAGAKAVPA